MLQSTGSQRAGYNWVTEQQEKSQQRKQMKEVIIGDRKRKKRLQGGLGSSWEKVSTYIEVCNVVNSCDSMHTEYDVTRIVCDVIQRVVAV